MLSRSDIKEVLPPPESSSFLIGPSKQTFGQEGIHRGQAAKPLFMLPSRVWISTTADIRPPCSAVKTAPDSTSTFRMVSVSKTEKNPIEWKGIKNGHSIQQDLILDGGSTPYKKLPPLVSGYHHPW